MREERLPFVRVVIPVFEDWDRLAICLAALNDQDYPGDRCEIVVVDNGSRVIPELPRISQRVQLLTCSTVGSYAARNVGIRDAEADVFAFTDADCIPDRGWLRNGVAALSLDSESPHLVGGRVDLFPREVERLTPVEVLELLFGFHQERLVKERHFGVTANLFVRRDTLRTLGGFREDLRSGGDRDFGKRAHAHGFRIEYSDDAVIAHPARRTREEYFGKFRRLIGGRIQALPFWRRWFALPLTLLMPPVGSMVRLARSDIGTPGDRLAAAGVLVLGRLDAAAEWGRVMILRRSPQR